MKKRRLPFRLITAITGLVLLFVAFGSNAGQPGDDRGKSDGSRFESARANQFTGTVNPVDVMKARQQAEALRTKSTSGAMGLNWWSVGPDNYPGLVWSCIFDNTDQTCMTLVAGAAGGGLWKSIDLGLTWNQMAVENNVVPKVSSIVQTSNGTIYAATGVTSCKSVRFNGTGIYTSLNGSSFTPIAATQSNPDFDGVSKLVLDKQSGRLYAGTVGGLYYSDNGTEWNKVKPGYAMDVCVGPDGTVIASLGDSAYMAVGGNLNSWVTLTTGKANALPKSGYGWMVFAIAPSDANVMYASFAAPDGKLLGVYTSTDKGATWSIIFPFNPTFEPFNGYGCYSNTLCVFPDDPYKILLGGVNMWYGQRVQTTGFYNWEQVSFGSLPTLIPEFAPSYHHSYMFRPNSPNQLVLATDGGVSVGTIDQGYVTFQTSNKMFKTAQFNSVSFSAQRGYVMGGGERIGTLAMGYFCPSQVSFPTEGYQVYRVDATLQPANYGGNGGSCEWSNVDSKVAIFTKYKGAPAIRRQELTDLVYDNDLMTTVDTVSSTYVPMRMWESFNFSGPRDTTTYLSAREDSTTIPAGTSVMVKSLCNGFLFPYVTPVDLPFKTILKVPDPVANRFFYYGSISGNRGIYMTKDALKFFKTPEYFVIHKDTAKVDIITTLAISADGNTLWGGTKYGRLIRVSGLLQAHDSATAIITSPTTVLVDSVFKLPALNNRMVTSIAISPVNSSQVLVTLGNYGNQDYVFMTHNGNDPVPSFSSITTNLPKAPVYSGLIEMHGNNAILGTDLGVFSTTGLDAGSPQWAPDMSGIGDVAVTEIRQQIMNDYHILNHGVIYLASFGRGLWMDTTYYTPLGTGPILGQASASGNLKLTPNPVTDVVTVSYDNPAQGNLVAGIYDLTGRQITSVPFGIQSKGTFTGKLELGALPKGTYIVRIGSSSGKIVKM